jgi:hypothetical protein
MECMFALSLSIPVQAYMDYAKNTRSAVDTPIGSTCQICIFIVVTIISSKFLDIYGI